MRKALIRNELARRAARRLPAPVRGILRSLLLGQPRPRWGNFRRLAPFSERYGRDRGTPVDRVYIDGFLARRAADIRGDVLEVRDSGYTERFGGAAVSGRHVLDLDAANPAATVVADISEPGSLPVGRFDCFILTQTFQYVRDPDAALANAWNALAPGGVLLLTVPTIARVDWPAGYEDLWRWTPAGLRRFLARALPEAEVEVEGHGNLLAATAFLMGLAAEELAARELEMFDPLYVVVTSARVARA